MSCSASCPSNSVLETRMHEERWCSEHICKRDCITRPTVSFWVKSFIMTTSSRRNLCIGCSSIPCKPSSKMNKKVLSSINKHSDGVFDVLRTAATNSFKEVLSQFLPSLWALLTYLTSIPTLIWWSIHDEAIDPRSSQSTIMHFIFLQTLIVSH